MQSYIVLLRGINVGGRNLLPMKDLVALLDEDGFQDVRTYIQSGNVLLRSENRPDNRIAALIKDRFGFSPQVLALKASEFESAIENNPFPAEIGKTVHFYFCKSSPVAKTERLARLKSETEEYYLQDNVFYLHAPEGIGRSKLAASIESCLGVSGTGRNLNTIVRLQKMVKDA